MTHSGSVVAASPVPLDSGSMVIMHLSDARRSTIKKVTIGNDMLLGDNEG